MLDPIVTFFTRVFQGIGRAIGFLIGIVLWPFLWLARWYGGRGWILKVAVGLVLLGLLALYANSSTPPSGGTTSTRTMSTSTISGRATCRPASRWRKNSAPETAKTCGRSAIADVDCRPHRLQRQPECLDLVDARSTSSACSASTGTARPGWTIRPPSSAVSTRRCGAPPPSSPTISAGCAPPRRSTATCRMRAAICNSTRRPGISDCIRSARRRRRRATTATR